MKKHLTALLLTFAGALAHADYPDKPLRLIVPFATGQSADVLTRFVADRLKDKLGPVNTNREAHRPPARS